MNLNDVPFGEIENFNVLIEIPKGSNEKWEYDWEAQKMVKNFQFTGDFSYPFYYGEILGTLGGDGDRLDAMVYSSLPLEQGSVIKCRAFGMLPTIDRGDVDDKIFCVPVNDTWAEKYKDITDLSPEQLEEVKKCWLEVAKQKKKTIELKGFRDKNATEEEIKKSLV
jgi:inorganic pyrophosphatase